MPVSETGSRSPPGSVSKYMGRVSTVCSASDQMVMSQNDTENEQRQEENQCAQESVVVFCGGCNKLSLVAYTNTFILPQIWRHKV